MLATSVVNSSPFINVLFTEFEIQEASFHNFPGGVAGDHRVQLPAEREKETSLHPGKH